MYETIAEEESYSDIFHNSEFIDYEGETVIETINSNRMTSSEKSKHAEGEKTIRIIDTLTPMERGTVR